MSRAEDLIKKIDRLKAAHNLYKRPGTDGEKQAAKNAIDRINSGLPKEHQIHVDDDSHSTSHSAGYYNFHQKVGEGSHLYGPYKSHAETGSRYSVHHDGKGNWNTVGPDGKSIGKASVSKSSKFHKAGEEPSQKAGSGQKTGKPERGYYKSHPEGYKGPYNSPEETGSRHAYHHDGHGNWSVLDRSDNKSKRHTITPRSKFFNKD